MDELDNSIKVFNLISTNTVKKDDVYDDDFDLNNTVVNYDNSINLYDLIFIYDKLHLSFKKEYDELGKLVAGKIINVGQYYNVYDANGDNYRSIEIMLYNPKLKHKYLRLYLNEVNGETKPYVTSGTESILSDKDYYRRSVKLNPQIVKQYLDFFERHQLLLDLYHRLKNTQLLKDDVFQMYTKINSNHDSVIEKQDSFEVYIGNNFYTTPDEYVKITTNLGDELTIDEDNSIIIVDGARVEADSEIYLDILKKTYINSEYLGKKKERIINNVKVKKLINLG